MLGNRISVHLEFKIFWGSPLQTPRRGFRLWRVQPRPAAECYSIAASSSEILDPFKSTENKESRQEVNMFPVICLVPLLENTNAIDNRLMF